MLKKSKRIVILFLSLVMFVGYFLITDPDAKIIQELPFGSQLVMLVALFVVAALAIAFIETYTDIYTDEIAKDEGEIAKQARNTAEGAGYVLIAKSVRILAYAIVMAALIASANGIM